MDEFMKALQEQFEFLVDSEDNNVDSFSRIDGENAFGFTTEDGEEFFVTVEPA